jgi:hypothetical protein
MLASQGAAVLQMGPPSGLLALLGVTDSSASTATGRRLVTVLQSGKDRRNTLLLPVQTQGQNVSKYR